MPLVAPAQLPPLDLLALYKLLRRAFMTSSWLVVEEEGVEMPLPPVPPVLEVLLDSGAATAATGFGVAEGALMAALESSSFLSSSDSSEDESALNNKSSMLPLMMIHRSIR
jgi:hypothetical protein